MVISSCAYLDNTALCSSDPSGDAVPMSNGAIFVPRVIMFVSALPFIRVFHYSYREKALQDAAAVSKHVERLLQSVGKVQCAATM